MKDFLNFQSQKARVVSLVFPLSESHCFLYSNYLFSLCSNESWRMTAIIKLQNTQFQSLNTIMEHSYFTFAQLRGTFTWSFPIVKKSFPKVDIVFSFTAVKFKKFSNRQLEYCTHLANYIFRGILHYTIWDYSRK